MRKLLKKKVKVFGKEISVLLIAMLAVMAVASAALISYFGVITGFATIEQSVLFDGEGVDTLTLPIEEPIGDVAGDMTYGEDHELENIANTWILVEVVSEKTCPADDCDGFTAYSEYKLMPTADGDGDQGIGDEDDIHFYFEPETWGSFINVTFNYNITEGPSDNRVPHVNAWLRNDDGEELSISTWNGGNPSPTISDGTATYEKSQFVTSAGGASVATGYDDWEIREVRIQSGNPGADPSDANDLQVVYVSNVKIDGEAIGNKIELPTSDYANVPGRIAEFRMIYGSVYNIYPGEYSVNTTVNYLGTIDESGVLITDTSP